MTTTPDWTEEVVLRKQGTQQPPALKDGGKRDREGTGDQRGREWLLLTHPTKVYQPATKSDPGLAMRTEK